MRDKKMDRIFTALVSESESLFIGWIKSEVFREIQKVSEEAGVSQDDMLAKFWRKQNQIAESLILERASLQRSLGKRKVFSAQSERIMRSGFQMAVEAIYGRASAESAWECIVAPRFTGFLEKKGDGEWRTRNPYDFGSQKVEVLAFEHVLIATDESGKEVATMEWEELTSWDSYYIFETLSEIRTLTDLLEDDSLLLAVPIELHGWIHLEPGWAEYLSSKGLPRGYE
jgi:hypothetical protein